MIDQASPKDPTLTVVSYSRLDSASALSLRDHLARLGADVWLDQTNVHAGSKWQDSIESAIRRCHSLIVLLSINSLASPEVEAEWSFALRTGKTVIPVLLEAVDVPFRLATIQHVQVVGRDLAIVARQLALQLPQRTDPPSQLVDWEGAARLLRNDPHRYLRLRLSSAVSPAPSKTSFLIIDLPAFGTVKSLLDHIYLQYLTGKVPQYSYGSEWLLQGCWTLVPSFWLDSAGSPIHEVDADWAARTPVSALLLDSGWPGWIVMAGSDLSAIRRRGYYGVRVRTERTLEKLSYHPKSSAYLLSRTDVFESGALRSNAQAVFRYELVASAHDFPELSGKVFEETIRAASDPKVLKKWWKIAGGLA